MSTSTAELLHPPFRRYTGPPPGLGYHRQRPVVEEAPTVPALQRGSNRLGLPRALSYGWLLGPVLLLAYWSLGSLSGFIDHRVLPAPWVAITTGIDLFHDGRLQTNVITSAWRAAQGLFFGGLTGVLVALLSGLSLTGGYVFDGVIQLKRAVPTLALIPFFILWFGISETMKVSVISLFVFLPLYLHTHNALRGIDLRYVELAETMRISYFQFLRHIVLPGALPGILLGIRFGVTNAWISLVVVEQINATSGIGYMISLARHYAQADIMLVGLVLYAVLGLASDFVVRLIEKKALVYRKTLAQ